MFPGLHNSIAIAGLLLLAYVAVNAQHQTRTLATNWINTQHRCLKSAQNHVAKDKAELFHEVEVWLGYTGPLITPDIDPVPMIYIQEAIKVGFCVKDMVSLKFHINS